MQKLEVGRSLAFRKQWRGGVAGAWGARGRVGDELAEVPRTHPSQLPTGQSRSLLRTGFGFPPAYDGKLGEQGNGE